MKTKTKVSFVVFFLSTLFFSFSYSYASSKIGVVSTSSDMVVLVARVDTLENLNERILNSVYWTLGVLATIFVALISVNLFINIKVNKTEIENIKANIEDAKQELLRITNNEIATSENEVLEKVSALNSKEFGTLRNEVINVVKKEVLESEAKVIEKITVLDKNKTADIEKIKQGLNVIKEKINDIEILTKEFEIDRFAAKGQQGEIIGLIDLLKISIDKDKYDIASRLVKVRDYVKSNPIRSYVATDLNRELAKIENKPEFGTIVEEVKKSINVFVD
jgi:hypothetical protein